METPIIAIVVGVLAIALLLFIMKRVVRMAIRLVIVGLILLVLLTGGVVWWWNGSGGESAPANDNRPGTTRRGNSR